VTRKDFAETIAETVRLNHVHALLPPDGGGEGSTASARGPVDDKLVVHTQSHSLEAEYFLYLAARMERALAEKGEKDGGKVLLVTGPSRESGKTLCALNLALAFARSFGREVLFLDADCRAGQAQRYLGYGDATLRGLTDVLGMSHRAGSVLLNTGLYELVYFPSGHWVEDAFSRRLDEEMLLLFQNLRQKFRLVVIDTPPAFPMPEAGILSSQADGTLLVLRAGRDGPVELGQCLDALKGSPILGAVLNDMPADMEFFSRYRRYGGYYGYGRNGLPGDDHADKGARG
jgi:Mrp family chromosome partitioning ATPase